METVTEEHRGGEHRVAHRALLGVWAATLAGLALALWQPARLEGAMAEAAAWGGVLLLACGTAVLTYQRLAHRYVIAPDRVWARHGLLWQQIDQMRYADISAVRVHRTPAGLLLGYGDLEFAAAGTEGAEVRFVRVAHPMAIKAQVNDRLRTGRTDYATSRH